MTRKAFNNQVAEAKGKIDALGDTLLGLWNTAVDAGDMLLTGLAGEENTQDLYEFVSGEEVGTLRERNGIVKGIEKGVNNTLNYVGDTVTGNKAPEEILSDLGKLGQGLYDDYIDPFAKEEKYKQENLFNGGLWTRSEKESYAKGQNEFKKDMVVAEVAASVLSAGTGTAVMRTVKTADKLNGPDGKKKSGDQEGNGKGVLLPDSSIDDAMSAMLKDGKLKTHGKSFAESMIELQEKVDKFLKQMTDVFNGRVVVIRDAATGHPMVYWMRHDDLPDSNGGGGGGNHRRSDKDNEGTGKPPNRIYDENGNPLPFGFSSVKQYNDFVKSLKEELPEGTQILFQGSSVTGVSHKKGLPFDQGRKSDFDIALVNDDLFLEALEIGRGGGFKMKTDPNRIGPLDEKQLDRLGLLEIIEKKSKEAGRPVSFMLYESVEQALKRPSLMVTP